jgi:hypothetical protein
VLSGISAFYNEGTGVAAAIENRLYANSTGSYMTFTVTNVTETGFRITYTETGSFAAGVLLWEAEGEL